MKLYNIKKKLIIPVSIDKAWEFFSSPANLKILTPDFMGFDIISEPEEKMYKGQIIEYIVRPILNLPMQWITEITQVDEPYYFIDEQRSGPYRFWHHKHFFRECDSGTEITDFVHYSLPFGILGRIALPIIVKKKLESIFEYREIQINKTFAK